MCKGHSTPSWDKSVFMPGIQQIAALACPEPFSLPRFIGQGFLSSTITKNGGLETKLKPKNLSGYSSAHLFSLHT